MFQDSLSMINLIMCIGFSVDFSAHVSYHFMSRQNMSVPERVKDSMYALGLPIVQGACSTIIGVIGLAMAPSYIFITFFKMVFLVIVLGALHGLILLPVLLSLFGPGTCDRGDRLDSKKTPHPVTSCENQNNENGVPPMANAIAVPVVQQVNGKLANHGANYGGHHSNNHNNHHNNSNGKKHSNGVNGKYVVQPIYDYEIKIPRPKHGPANGSAGSYSNNSYSQSNGGSRASSRPRSTSASPAMTSTNVPNLPFGRQKLASHSEESSVGIKLREMYTNRAFVCEDDYRRHQRALQ